MTQSPTIRHFINNDDPNQPIFELDTVRRTVRVIASRVGAMRQVWLLTANEDEYFKAPKFSEVALDRDQDGRLFYQRILKADSACEGGQQ